MQSLTGNFSKNTMTYPTLGNIKLLHNLLIRQIMNGFQMRKELFAVEKFGITVRTLDIALVFRKFTTPWNSGTILSMTLFLMSSETGKAFEELFAKLTWYYISTEFGFIFECLILFSSRLLFPESSIYKCRGGFKKGFLFKETVSWTWTKKRFWIQSIIHQVLHDLIYTNTWYFVGIVGSFKYLIFLRTCTASLTLFGHQNLAFWYKSMRIWHWDIVIGPISPTWVIVVKELVYKLIHLFQAFDGSLLVGSITDA